MKPPASSKFSGRQLARYYSLGYDRDTFDCADLVVMVQKELFGREVILPRHNARGTSGQRAISRRINDYLIRTDNPVDGDVVLMQEIGLSYPGHVGVYFRISGEGCVLHTSSHSRGAIITPVRELSNSSLAFKDYYTWQSQRLA